MNDFSLLKPEFWPNKNVKNPFNKFAHQIVKINVHTHLKLIRSSKKFQVDPVLDRP